MFLLMFYGLQMSASYILKSFLTSGGRGGGGGVYKYLEEVRGSPHGTEYAGGD